MQEKNVGVWLMEIGTPTRFRFSAFAGSNPVAPTMFSQFSQRVEESGCPRPLWKRERVGSNPTLLTKLRSIPVGERSPRRIRGAKIVSSNLTRYTTMQLIRSSEF